MVMTYALYFESISNFKATHVRPKKAKIKRKKSVFCIMVLNTEIITLSMVSLEVKVKILKIPKFCS